MPRRVFCFHPVGRRRCFQETHVSHPRPIVVYSEHPDWFRPLFAELDRRGHPYLKLGADPHRFDPAAAPQFHLPSREPGATGPTRALVFNRMSPSAWKRGRAHAIPYTLHYLRWLEHAGVHVVNGLRAFTVETSKALQLSILQRLGLRAPRTRVLNHPAELLVAAADLAFPLVVKPNIGGSGAGVVRFDRPEDLAAAVAAGEIAPALDGVLLLQEFHPPIGD